MRLIPILFLYQHKLYKGTVNKIPGTPVEYHLNWLEPPILMSIPVVFVSDPSGDRLTYFSSELNDEIAAAIVDSCKMLQEPLHG